LSLVQIANETSRQHSIYKKSCLSPLNDIDYENHLKEKTPPNDFILNKI